MIQDHLGTVFNKVTPNYLEFTPITTTTGTPPDTGTPFVC